MYGKIIGKGKQMTIDRFTKEKFEKFMEGQKPYEALGLIDGEYCYRIILDGQSAIMLRSSIGANGLAKESGKDSIRLWLVGNDDKPIGSKLDSWTTRVSGWQNRLFDKIFELVKRRNNAGDCRKCGKPFGIYKNRNNKKLFVKCFPCSKYLGKNIKGNLNSEGWRSRTSLMVTTKNQVQNLIDNGATVEDLKKISDPKPETVKTALDEFLADPFAEDRPETEEKPTDSFPPNTQQKLAIEKPIDMNVRLLAGPGTGKTFTIKHRVKRLISEGVRPENILVITYSKAMADEMGEKILSLSPDAIKEQISTIHAFCYRELTRNNQELKYFGWQVPGKFAPLKSWQVKAKIEDLISNVWPKNSKEKPGYKEVLEWIDRSKHYGIDHDLTPEWFTSYLGSFFGLNLAKIRVQFDKWFYSHHCLTFADMLFLMEQELISNSDFKAKMQAKYSHIIIDEAHDTNYQAFRILYHFFENGTKLFLVADVNQMMYRFQGAKPEYVTDEIDKMLLGIETVMLETNHRSNDEIIDRCQKLIAYNYSDKNGPYDQKFFQNIEGIRGLGGSVQFDMADDIFDESTKIAEEINTLCTNGYKPGNIFIGARTKAQLGYLEGELLKAGIKFINIAGGSFWNGRDVKNVVSYLRLIHNTDDKEALKQVANIASNDNCYTWNDKSGKFQAGDYCPTRYLGAKFLEKISYNFNNIDNFLFSAKDAWRYKTNDRDYDFYGPTKAQDLQEFVWQLQESALQAENIGQIIQVILDDCYEKYLKTTEGTDFEDENSKTDNLTTVIDIATQYTKIEDFLAYVDEMVQASKDAKDKNWDDYVVISTYHRLKGLERKIIFGMGWCEGIHSITGEPVGLLPHTFSLVDPLQFGVLPAGVKSPIEDERCIGFVCVSRAMEMVYLSGCAEYRGNKMWVSRFINEMGLEEIRKEKNYDT
jgi:DNA helicase-2/ATP-dependent DNA helicase PcrA